MVHNFQTVNFLGDNRLPILGSEKRINLCKDFIESYSTDNL